jgi:hypothetical protein
MQRLCPHHQDWTWDSAKQEETKKNMMSFVNNISLLEFSLSVVMTTWGPHLTPITEHHTTHYIH